MNARTWIRTVLPPAAFGVLFLLAWEAVVKGFDLKPFFLPAPTAIGDALRHTLRMAPCTVPASRPEAALAGRTPLSASSISLRGPEVGV